MNQLILSFIGIVGTARAALSEHVQKRLFDMGYRTSYGLEREVRFPQASCITLWTGGNQKPVVDFYTQTDEQMKGCLPEIESWGATTFHANDKLDEFLTHAKGAINMFNSGPVEQWFEGIKATIGRDGVVLDPSNLIARVELQAHEFRRKRFGAS